MTLVLERATAAERARAACEAGSIAELARAARDAAASDALSGPAATLADLLAAAQPARATAPDDSQLWMLQRLDGTLLALVRLRANGEVANAPHANESRWAMSGGKLALVGEHGRATTTFTIAGTSGGAQGGKPLHAGLFMDGRTVHVLSAVDCVYSRMRLLDRELVDAWAGVLDPDTLAPVGLPEVPAVILAAPRTGSHLLINLLNSSGRVFFDAELFNEDRISIFGADVRDGDAQMLRFVREHDPAYFARVMTTRSHHVDGRRLRDVRVRGFKLFARQSRRALDWAIDEPRMRVVHLHRANLLAEYSSLLVAHADGHWVGGPATLKKRRIAFDARRFASFVATKRAWLDTARDRLARRAGPSIEIEYADFTRQRVNEVLSFLLDEKQDLPLDALGLKRQLAERVIDRFENPDEVKRALDALGCEAWADVEGRDVVAL